MQWQHWATQLWAREVVMNFKLSAIAAFLFVSAVPAKANEIIMNCGSPEYPWAFKYVSGWFTDKVYERSKATWVEACTMDTLDILGDVTKVVKRVKDGGVQCDYEFTREDGTQGSNYLNLDFITLSYEHIGTGKCERLNDK